MESPIDPAQWNQVISISIPALGLLLLGNLYFISQLVRKINKLDETVTGVFPVYNNRLQTVEADTKRFAEDLKAIGELRERVAILEYAQREKGQGA